MAAYLSQQYKGLSDGNDVGDHPSVVSATPVPSVMASANVLSSITTPSEDSEADESMDEDAPLFTPGRQIFQSKRQSNTLSEAGSPFAKDQSNLFANATQSPLSHAVNRSIVFSDDEDIEDALADNVPQLAIQRRNNRVILSDSDDDAF